MTKVYCDFKNCEYNDCAVCTKESITLDKFVEPIKMGCPDGCPESMVLKASSDPVCDEFEIYNAVKTIKSVCENTTCKKCPLYNELCRSCGLREDSPIAWDIRRPMKIWRVFE